MKPTSKKRIYLGSKNILPIAKALAKRVLGVDEKEAKRRKKICDPCKHSVPDTALGGTMCDLCLCNIETKVYSNDEDHLCEKGYWTDNS